MDVKGLTGLRPTKESVIEVTAPPYDVIKPGTDLENELNQNVNSLFHITLGPTPKEALDRLIAQGKVQDDNEPAFYVYEQNFNGQQRTGVFVAASVSEYAKGEIIRHEKTFDEKVKGRMELRHKTGYSFGPVFLLTKSPISAVMDKIKNEYTPEYEFTSDFNGTSELDGIKNRVFRVLESSERGQELKQLLDQNPLYIADGHHRYHTSLLNNQTHFLTYVCEKAQIQAYNRVVNGTKKFDEIKDKFDLKKVEKFETPKKHQFCFYTKEGIYTLDAKEVPQDVVGRLDCSILEREVYPVLGLSHEMIMDHKYFDYYSEAELDKMMECVDSGKYDMAIALHPVSIDELMAVADAGLENSDIVMPEKSTFFAPKILSGLFIYKHQNS